MKRLSQFLQTPALGELDRRGLVLVGVTSITMNVLLFAMPLYSLQIFDRVLTSRSAETLVMLTLLVAFALISTAWIEAIRSRSLLRIGNAYALRLAPRLLNASVSYSAKTSRPEGQPVRDIMTIRAFLMSNQGLSVLFDAPLAPFFLLAVFFIHVGLGIAMLAGMLLLALISFLTELMVGSRLKASATAMLTTNQRTEAVTRNADAIEAMGMREGVNRYWDETFRQAIAEGSVAGDRTSALSAWAKLARMGFSLMMTALGAWYAIHDQLTIGGMVAANILAARGMAPLEALVAAWKGLIGTRSAAERINQALEQYPRDEGTITLPPPAAELSAERVIYFPIGAEQPTLKGISFSLPPGTWLGVVGPSAAGKSTLLKIICGIWRPRTGVVRLDGANVFSWKREDFGRHCGYLPQDVELFAGTVRDNIARFTTCDDALVIEAAQKANVHDMILRLSKGYETEIGTGGAFLSAGQRQRIGLARAMFGSPCLLVLDEPNSNLDADGEQALVDAISRARTDGATIVMVSHRPSLLAGADMIAVMMDGQLQKIGKREEVLGAITPLSAAASSSEIRRVAS